MNDQGSKKIIFSKSSLLSLKAELLKKQEEVYEKKQLPQHKVENFRPPPAKAPDKTENAANRTGKKSFRDGLKSIDVEELEACRKSKLALEKKAELYEHLTDSSGNSQLAGRFLVDFSAKKQEEVACPDSIPDDDSRNEEVSDYKEESENGEDSEWVEFTDCLGRTRKCHKTDLVLYEQRDKELMRAMGIGNSVVEQPDTIEDNNQTEKPILVQKTNDYLQSLREKWEKKEQELLAKDKDIHYQDLLFDEARMHGVGYYSFSTNEAERQQQMEELIKRREETLKAQKEAEEKRRKREELVAARVAASRARQRARAGLPPEDPNEKNKDFAELLVELLNKKKDEVDAKEKEREKAIKEEQDKVRQKLREAYVREWDIGKEGLNETKKFRQMTQEEYVEQQRNKRVNEFAPPQTSSYNNNNSFDEKGNMLHSSVTGSNKTWEDVRPQVKTPPPATISELGDELPSRGLYFSSTDRKREVKYKNFVHAKELSSNSNNTNFNHLNIETPSSFQMKGKVDKQSKEKNRVSPKGGTSGLKYKIFVRNDESTPIIDELSDENTESEETADKMEVFTNGSEIAPPPTYEYYGPLPKRSKIKKPFESDIREAYAQGAESLKTRSNVKKLSNLYDFTFD